ncbi:elicitor-responsive protein 1-like [Bidens hawaiensis]|uniref:elicitor-responsive protein 1-like n=1 Tax=Bidens hawaiensis TaxID=980011 RepID=UPI004049DC42
MKGGVLEVFLESAKGIRHTNLIGKPKYYVIVECGIQHHKSKSSKGDHHKVSWNEKLAFELSMYECEKLTHLGLRIMDKELFHSDTGFVGEAKVYLDEILVEGNEKGLVEQTPKPYKVVLDDETYRGEIRIGLKFIPDAVIRKEGKEVITMERSYEDTIWNRYLYE